MFLLRDAIPRRFGCAENDPATAALLRLRVFKEQGGGAIASIGESPRLPNYLFVSSNLRYVTLRLTSMSFCPRRIGDPMRPS